MPPAFPRRPTTADSARAAADDDTVSVSRTACGTSALIGTSRCCSKPPRVSVLDEDALAADGIQLLGDFIVADRVENVARPAIPVAGVGGEEDLVELIVFIRAGRVAVRLLAAVAGEHDHRLVAARDDLRVGEAIERREDVGARGTRGDACGPSGELDDAGAIDGEALDEGSPHQRDVIRRARQLVRLGEVRIVRDADEKRVDAHIGRLRRRLLSRNCCARHDDGSGERRRHRRPSPETEGHGAPRRTGNCDCAT
jgi:hypothetical protein